MASEKTCTKCGETKPLDGYRRDKRMADGRRGECKECVRERDRRYCEENRDKIREYNRRYYEDNREKERGRYRRYYEENREKVLDRKRLYNEENSDKKREYDRRYREENRDIINQGNKMRGAQYRRTSNLLAGRKGTPYSPEEDALLLANNGMTIYQKAVTLGRTYRSCEHRRQLLRSREAVDV